MRQLYYRFQDLESKREPVKLDDLGVSIERRRAAVSEVDVPRTQRTPSKRALVKAIEDPGGKW